MNVRFHIITLFPEYFDSPLQCGLIGKARQKDILDFNLINPRNFALDRHKSVDDKPYGGGPGMVMLMDPLVRALKTLPAKCRKILLTPKGFPLSQRKAAMLSREEDLALVCGRYEGIDARIEELFELEHLSVGDFVLNGGEAAALCLIEAVSRYVPGFMGRQESTGEESFSAGLLEYPHYTRPEEYESLQVPQVLLTGDHARIARWRREKALENTLEYRPELLSEKKLQPEDISYLRNLPRSCPGRNLNIALVHHPVKNKTGQECTTSLTNLDIHDIGRVCATYGLGQYFLCTPLEDQRALADRLISHWIKGAGAEANPDRSRALSGIRVCSSLEEVVRNISQETGVHPVVIATRASGTGNILCRDIRSLLAEKPVLMILGTGYGLSAQVIDKADYVLNPVRLLARYNHLSVRSAASILVDRILGDFA